MVENPEKEIMLDPRWGVIEDGLGYNVLVTGGMPSVDKEGRAIVILTIMPDDIVRKRYNLRRDIELDSDGKMKLIVLKTDLIPLNMFDDANRKWLYTKSFRHEPTELSDREVFLQKKLNTYERKVLLLEADVLRLQEQLEIARTNPAKFIKQGAEVFQESAKAFSEMMKRPEEKQ
jgi:hypothetical protein